MDGPGELNEFMLQPRGKGSLSTYIADQYRLSDFSIAPLRSSSLSLVAKVKDKTSGPIITYCLKSHAAGKTCERVEAQHDAVMKIRSAGFHLLPSAVRTVSGASVFSAESKLWSMYDFVESAPAFDWTYCTWGEEEAAAAGQALASLHFASAKVKVSALDVGSPRVLDNVESWLRAAVIKLASNAGDAFALREPLTTSLFDSLTRLVGELRSAQIEEALLLHGDYHPGNLLFKSSSKVAGVVDYDDLQIGQRVQDVAYGALTFALGSEKENAAAVDESVVSEQRLSAFLKAYEREWQRKSKVNVWDQEELASWIKLSAFLIIYWCLDRMGESRDNIPLFRVPVEMAVRVATGTCAVISQKMVSVHR
jgi:Ser/Thr protein kinase RdoA (MazF antagonist)